MEDRSENVRVGVAEIRVSSDGETLASSALGSCVGVAIYDPVKHIGGLAHIMLPSQMNRNGAHPAGKFADVAVPTLIEELRAAGALRNRLVAKVIGGAEMFGDSGPVSIGERNVFAVMTLLRKSGVKIVGSDTGGHHARTVEFNTATGAVTISSVRAGVKEL